VNPVERYKYAEFYWVLNDLLLDLATSVNIWEVLFNNHNSKNSNKDMKTGYYRLTVSYLILTLCKFKEGYDRYACLLTSDQRNTVEIVS